MSNIDKHALREAAVRAGGVKWQYMRATQHSKAYITDDKGSTVVNCTDGDVPAKCAGFIAAANPATVLALLDELEVKDRRIAEQADIIAKQDKWIRSIEEAMIFATDRAEAAEKRSHEMAELLINLKKARPGGVYFNKWDTQIDSVLRTAGIAAAAGKGE